MAEEVVWAIKNGDIEKVKKLSSAAAFEVNGFLLNKRKAIHIAADYGQKDVIEYLVSQGADVNDTDGFGITPLLAAIFEGHAACVQFLISKGADYKSLQTPDGQSYADAAEDESIRDMLK